MAESLTLAKGYRQTYAVDYFETFLLVAILKSVRVILYSLGKTIKPSFGAYLRPYKDFFSLHTLLMFVLISRPEGISMYTSSKSPLRKTFLTSS